LSNFLRSVGNYRTAVSVIETAEGILKRGIPSHDAELAHCSYAKNVSYAVTGISYFDAAQFGRTTYSDLFAGALMLLSYSHAAWFVDRIEEAVANAERAAQAFGMMGADIYAARATSLAQLIRCYEKCRSGQLPDLSRLRPDLGRAVAVLMGYSREAEWLGNTLGTVRPSLALGLLQFGRDTSPIWTNHLAVKLPLMMRVNDQLQLSWEEPPEVESLAQADVALRLQMGVPSDARVPLIAD
jgi:hypothetical protein